MARQQYERRAPVMRIAFGFVGTVVLFCVGLMAYEIWQSFWPATPRSVFASAVGLMMGFVFLMIGLTGQGKPK
jgi:hypothetical protein